METRSKKEIAREIDKARRQLDQVLKDTASVMPGRRRLPTWHVTRDTCQLLQKRVAEGSHVVQERFAESAQRLQRRVLDSANQADEAVHKNPYPFLAGAVGLGMLFTLLARRRKRTG